VDAVILEREREKKKTPQMCFALELGLRVPNRFHLTHNQLTLTALAAQSGMRKLKR
jgi:hypothetical protein